jgi:AcrR family transcriptional regulator
MGTREDQHSSTQSGDARVSGLKRYARQRNDESLIGIRAAAALIFRRDGYTAATMEQLAREGGVTRQTLYRHFPSKYDLALDFMGTSAQATLDTWRSLCDCDIGDRACIHAWVRSVIAHHVGRDDIRAYVELTSTEPAYRRVLADQIGQIITTLAEALPFFDAAATNPSSIEAAKAHLFVATLMERSDFIALGEEWFAREHLENIMTDWLMRLTFPDP